jgi:hypothetical protein
MEIKLIIKYIAEELIHGMVPLQGLALLTLSKVAITLFQSEPHTLHICEILQWRGGIRLK